MMLNAETRALLVREAMLRSGAWKTPDPDEGKAPRCCEVPGCDAPIVPTPFISRHGTPALRKPKRGTRVCNAHVREGWRSLSCVRCGGVTRTWAWTKQAKRPSTYGTCPTCQKELHEADETIPTGVRSEAA